MRDLPKRDCATFFDVMSTALNAGIGPGELQPNYIGNEKVLPIKGRRCIEWRNIPAWEGATLERLSIHEDQSVYFGIFSRFAHTFDKRHHSRFSINLRRIDGHNYGCTKWNPACHGNTHPIVAAHVILQELRRALLPEAFDKAWAEFSRQCAKRGQPLEQVAA